MGTTLFLRLLLAAGGAACLLHGIRGLGRGSIRLKGVTSTRRGEPATFWSSVLVILGFGALMLWFAAFGRFGG